MRRLKKLLDVTDPKLVEKVGDVLDTATDVSGAIDQIEAIEAAEDRKSVV